MLDTPPSLHFPPHTHHLVARCLHSRIVKEASFFHALSQQLLAQDLHALALPDTTTSLVVAAYPLAVLAASCCRSIPLLTPLRHS